MVLGTPLYTINYLHKRHYRNIKNLNHRFTLLYKMHGFFCFLKMYTRPKIEYINKNNIVVEMKLINLWS